MATNVMKVLGLVVVLSVTACESTGRRHTSLGSDDFPLAQLEARRVGYTTRWTKDLAVGKKEEISKIARLDDLIALVETPRNILSLMSVRDGKVYWRTAIGTEIDQFHEPRLYGEKILVNSATQMYHVPIDTGRPDYVTKLDAPVDHAPAIVGRVAIFGSADGTVFAHNIAAGFANWKYKMPSEIRAAPIAIGLQVFVADTLGVYKMFEASSGELLWDGRSFEPIVAQPAAGATILVPSYDQTLYSLDRNSGRDRWQFRDSQPLKIGPEVVGKNVYLPLARGGMIAISGATGKEIWRTEDTVQPIAVHGEKLVLSGGDGLRWVEAATGEVLDEVATHPLRTVLAGPDNSLILVSEAGYLQRIDPVK